MNLHHVWTVLRKEFVDNLRDRRAMTTALLMPLLFPCVLGAMYFMLKDEMHGAQQITVPVDGRAHAPELMHFLEHHNVTLEEAPPANEQVAAIREKRVPFVLVIPDTFEAQLRAGEPAVVHVLGDTGGLHDDAKRRQLEGLLEGYGASIGGLRLLMRGVDPALAHAIVVDKVDAGTPASRGSLLTMMLPMMLLSLVFIGGLYLAIDSTAGERERGSLEALLLNPVTPASLLMGKTLAVAMFNALTLIEGVVLFGVATRVIPFASIGIELHFDVVTGLLLLGIALPMCAMTSSFQVAVGLMCKTFKTAQSALGGVSMFFTFPVMFLDAMDVKLSAETAAIPVIGHALLMRRVVRGESVPLEDLGLSVLTTLLLAVAAFLVARRLLGERITAGND